MDFVKKNNAIITKNILQKKFLKQIRPLFLHSTKKQTYLKYANIRNLI